MSARATTPLPVAPARPDADTKTRTTCVSPSAQAALVLVPTHPIACDAFSAIGLECDPASHDSGVHRAGPEPLILSDRSGDRIELAARLTRWDSEPGHPAEDEVIVDLGVGLLELKSPTAVREVRARLSRFTEHLDQLADQLVALQNERLRQAASDPATDLGRLLAEHNISVLVANGPNAAWLDSALLMELSQGGGDTLLLPPGAELPEILTYVREAIPGRVTNRSAGRSARSDSSAPPPSAGVLEPALIDDGLAAYLAEHGLRLIRETDRRHIEVCRLGNDMHILVPAEASSDQILDCARRHVANRSPIVQHGRTWTYINRVDGAQRTVTCPSFCRNDHSSEILSPTHPADIWHQDHGVGVHVPLSDSNEPATPWRVLEPQLAVIPESEISEKHRMPHVVVEFAEDIWTDPLGPDELAALIETLSGGLDKLRVMHNKLVTARADWPTTPCRKNLTS
ncbi:DUF6907 domain-containing protein [Streptomyces sp. NRRL B-3648]|uniref:DUF6907 domain-containing protein n=1 Tax=Streptomyces sp. NRRL B-3648 TaxID=1519493 RepID=UPI000AD1341A|nr:hypothetical protein [Streptomyces sp. NRRL B-3648]